MNGLWRDVRFGVRMLAKNPAFTAIAVLTLALGIGANAGIFTILQQVILRRLPVPNPDQLVLLYSPGPKQGHLSSDENSAPGEEGSESFSYPLYLATLRDHNPVFSGLAAMSPHSERPNLSRPHRGGRRLRCLWKFFRNAWGKTGARTHA